MQDCLLSAVFDEHLRHVMSHLIDDTDELQPDNNEVHLGSLI